MEFTSIIFAIFYSFIFVLYWQVAEKNRNIILLVANVGFYLSFGIKYAFILLYIIVFSFFAAKVLEQKRKKEVLMLAVLGTIAFLVIFKYLGFGIQILNEVFSVLGLGMRINSIHLIAPIGISYYTFQAISYLADVYLGKIKAEKDFLTYAIYISFFPIVLSGPIERAKNLIEQLHEERNFNYSNVVLGLERILWGCFKKLVIADNLAVYVNAVGDNVYEYTGFAIVLANLGFTIQLYCDFSGYSDMAIGFAKMLNIHLEENFKAPYFSTSIKEFWSRWHISLSGWLRDYIYIPLGGSRCSKIRGMFNLMLTFLVSGIWHGAGIKYLIWGGMHGILQCAEKVFMDIFNVPKTKRKVSKLLSIIVTFLIINFTWLPFWLPTTRSFLYALTHMFDGVQNIGSYIRNGINEFNINSFMVVTLLISLSVLIIHDYKAKKSEVYDRFVVNSKLERRIVRISLLLLVLCFNCVSGSGFIYFQF